MLELIDLRRRFGDVQALEGLSFEVPPGQLFGFVGPNGAGKTTTMRIVCGLLRPDAGAVRWDGEEIDFERRRAIGYMPEERGLYPKMRVGDQLSYLAQLHGLDGSAARDATTRWLERLGLGERLGDRADQLSLGNQQRVQLAAALVHDPGLLVLDEPFAGLDPIGTDVLAEVLRERAEAGVPVLFSSHQLELVERLCSGVAIIDAGRLVASGPVDELRRGRAHRVLRVDVDGGGERWWEAAGGVASAERRGQSTHLTLADGADPQHILDAARASGTVTHFSEVEPSLADVFREAVGA
ncbi:MAG: ATP-binding cassette domain-containing protein [Actinomycetota bacterium]|nr:ATP-binding cassette domain-containing protein [Actinomycetota bacterium]